MIRGRRYCVTAAGIVALALGLALALAAAPRTAHAGGESLVIGNDDVHKRLDLAVLVHGIWWGGIVSGVRLGIPVAPAGFLKNKNDQVKLEIGVSFQHWWTHNIKHNPHGDPGDPDPEDRFVRMAFPLLVRWDFFVAPWWTIDFSIGVEIGWVLDDWWVEHLEWYYWWITPAFALGSLFNVHDRVSIRLDFAHSGVNLGVEFKLGK